MTNITPAADLTQPAPFGPQLPLDQQKKNIMIQFKVLELGFEGTVKRFMLMMIGTILIGLTGQFFLAIVWTMVLSVSCILSIKVTVGTPKQKAVDGKLVQMDRPRTSKKVS